MVSELGVALTFEIGSYENKENGSLNFVEEQFIMNLHILLQEQMLLFQSCSGPCLPP